MRLGVWVAISMAPAGCSAPAKPEPPREPATQAPAPADDEEAVVAREAATAKPVDDKHPRIFPWAMWRERNDQWLAVPSDNHCDPRNDHHPRRKGESECYPPSNVQLAVIVTRTRFLNNNTKIIELTVDRGYRAAVSRDYFISLLDADGRPATRWIHPTEVADDISRFVIPYPHGLNLEAGKSRAAIVEWLTSDDRFDDGDPRSAP
jgi:hypothetical protein